MATLVLTEVTDSTSRSIGGGRECRDIRISVDQDHSRLRVCMTLNAVFDFRRAVVARCGRHHRDVARGVGQVFVEGDGDWRPRSGTGMARSARRYRRDEVALCRRRANSLPRNHMSRIGTVMLAVVTGLTRYRRDHRVIHRRLTNHQQ